MQENEKVIDTDEAREAINHPPPSTAIPKPVFMRLLMLFGGGAGCLFVGIIVALVTGDSIILAMSAILSIAFISKGYMLKRKINSGQIYNVSGVCVSTAPKIFGRYKHIELVDTITGNDVHFILPKKVVFKVGHVYNCYFDNSISNRPVNINNAQSSFINADLDLPTNGFLGFEDFGIYQEKPVVITAIADDETNINDNQEEKAHEASKHYETI